MNVLSSLEPSQVFRYFEEICRIPHGSSHTKQISDFCMSFAQKRNLRCIQDEANNVIIFKDGTAGYEESAPVILQGHLDMVCEKEPDCQIDFQTDGLTLVLQNGIISAEGTTLGGDDGIAIAYALAILDADDIPHPPLEIVFTADEEIGMLGAAALDCSPLQARTMLNLDSEEEGYLLVSCAGGVTATAHLPIQRSPGTGKRVRLSVQGLLGGHSGVEIDKGRANACQLLGRALYALQKDYGFCLIDVQGGKKDNAIPREANAGLLLNESTDLRQMAVSVSELQDICRREYAASDADIQISLSTAEPVADTPVLTQDDSRNVIAALVNLPGGIQKMSQELPGLVQTSLNLGILNTEEREVLFSFSVRSSMETEKRELTDRIACLMDILGGTVSLSGDYPAWEYRKESPLRDTLVSVYEKQYGKKPVIQAIHAGLECGLFAGKLPGLDCVSLGPDMTAIHTTEESMNVESVQRTWHYVLEVLKELK